METEKSAFLNGQTRDAFDWLTQPESLQAKMLEKAMRNYNDPVYSVSLIAKHLMKAFESDIFGYKGDTSEIKFTILAITIYRYTRLHGWDIVPEKL